MKVLVIGKNGQLGKSLYGVVNSRGRNYLSNFVFIGKDELDLSSDNNIDFYFENSCKFDVVINCAAYTKVDKAEQEEELVDQINHKAVKRIAKAISKYKGRMIHISTDYVFGGGIANTPYTEESETAPINVYGKTKLFGEKAIQEEMPTNAIIIRTSWLYSEHGSNFVKNILRLCLESNRLDVVEDQLGSPTYAINLAEAILHILDNSEYIAKNKPTQIFHYSDYGVVSWYDFSLEILKLSKINCTVGPIVTGQRITPAKRPLYSAMSSRKIVKEFDVKVHHWKRSIKRFIDKYEDL